MILSRSNCYCSNFFYILVGFVCDVHRYKSDVFAINNVTYFYCISPKNGILAQWTCIPMIIFFYKFILNCFFLFHLISKDSGPKSLWNWVLVEKRQSKGIEKSWLGAKKEKKITRPLRCCHNQHHLFGVQKATLATLTYVLHDSVSVYHTSKHHLLHQVQQGKTFSFRCCHIKWRRSIPFE